MERAYKITQRLRTLRKALMHRRKEADQQRQDEVMALPAAATETPCVYCKGAGFTRADVPVGHPDFGKAVSCQCLQDARRRAQRQQLRAQTQIDQLRAFREASFDTFDHRLPGLRSAYEAVLRYSERPDGWLVLECH